MLRRSTYVVPPEDESSSEEETTPLQKIVRHNQQERDGSIKEDDIPTINFGDVSEAGIPNKKNSRVTKTGKLILLQMIGMTP